jgi:surface polysaccharide O-acyltransferase-like enzyme
VKKLRYASKADINVSLLKMLMSFCVILAHCWKSKNYHSLFFFPFKEMEVYAVPIFMIIAFYYSEYLFVSRNRFLFSNRIIRLLVPHLGWALIYWLYYLLVYKTPVTELFWQILTGHSTVLNPTMWFQVELILFTLLFFFLFYHLENTAAISVIIILSIISLVLQFSGINYSLFKDLRPELSYPIGRIAELFPFAAFGFFLRYFGIFDKLKNHKTTVLLICAPLLVLPYIFRFPRTEGFGYAGMMVLYMPVMIFFFVCSLPLNKLPIGYKKIAVMISSYTLGIYCSHRLVSVVLKTLYPGFAFSSFSGCIIIYLVSYLICFLIALIPNKYVKGLTE